MSNLDPASVAEYAPITRERYIKAIPDGYFPFPHPERARATFAPSTECPDGNRSSFPAYNSRESPKYRFEELSVLQKHVAFFNSDRADGIIFPWDTFEGFRKLGYNLLLSAFATLAIHASMSMATWESHWWWPFPNPEEKMFFPIYMERLHAAKHGSDTGSYDSEGRFVPIQFEQIFIKRYFKSNTTDDGWISIIDLWEMLHANRNAFDLFGTAAAFFEWGFLWLLVADPNGRGIRREDVRSCLDGTLFYKIASKQEK